MVSSPANVRYLSGYAGSNGLMLISAGEAHFFTDPRYATVAGATITCKAHVAKGPLILGVADVIKRKRLRKIGFEPAWMNLDQFEHSRTPCRPAPPCIRRAAWWRILRAVKSPAEIALIRRSVLANSEAYAQGPEAGASPPKRTGDRRRTGVPNEDVWGGEAGLRYHRGRGERSALPHAHPTARPVRKMNYY